jgi:polysaccharide export outer membrane protein
MMAPSIFGRRWVAACLVAASCSLVGGARAAAQAGAPASGAVTSGVTSGVNPVQAAPSTGASNPTSQAQNQAMLYPGEDFLLGRGDLITVHVFGSLDYNVTVRVGLDGTVELPYIGSISLQGDSVRKAQTQIEDRLRTGGFFMNPDVIIQVLDTVNGSVTITGEMHTTVPVTTERSLRDVLLTAGGLPPNASHTVKIVRPVAGQPGQTQVISVELGTDLAASETANVPVYPHDIIQISRASVVYVLGAFKQQGSVPLDQAMPLTLMRLAALSGGVGFEGKYEDLRLIRTVNSKPMVVEVDIKKVLNGKAPDPILQADDIVFLPTNNMKAILKNLGVGGVIGLVSVLIAIRSF